MTENINFRASLRFFQEQLKKNEPQPKKEPSNARPFGGKTSRLKQLFQNNTHPSTSAPSVDAILENVRQMRASHHNAQSDGLTEDSQDGHFTFSTKNGYVKCSSEVQTPSLGAVEEIPKPKKLSLSTEGQINRAWNGHSKQSPTENVNVELTAIIEPSYHCPSMDTYEESGTILTWFQKVNGRAYESDKEEDFLSIERFRSDDDSIPVVEEPDERFLDQNFLDNFEEDIGAAFPDSRISLLPGDLDHPPVYFHQPFPHFTDVELPAIPEEVEGEEDLDSGWYGKSYETEKQRAAISIHASKCCSNELEDYPKEDEIEFCIRDVDSGKGSLNDSNSASPVNPDRVLCQEESVALIHYSSLPDLLDDEKKQLQLEHILSQESQSKSMTNIPNKFMLSLLNDDPCSMQQEENSQYRVVAKKALISLNIADEESLSKTVDSKTCAATLQITDKQNILDTNDIMTCTASLNLINEDSLPISTDNKIPTASLQVTNKENALNNNISMAPMSPLDNAITSVTSFHLANEESSVNYLDTKTSLDSLYSRIRMISIASKGCRDTMQLHESCIASSDTGPLISNQGTSHLAERSVHGSNAVQVSVNSLDSSNIAKICKASVQLTNEEGLLDSGDSKISLVSLQLQSEEGSDNKTSTASLQLNIEESEDTEVLLESVQLNYEEKIEDDQDSIVSIPEGRLITPMQFSKGQIEPDDVLSERRKVLGNLQLDITPLLKKLYNIASLSEKSPEDKDDSIENFARQLMHQESYICPVEFPLKCHKAFVIIDLGSSSTRAGILMDQATLPQLFFPTVCATNKFTGQQVIAEDALLPDTREASVLSFPLRLPPKITKHTIDVSVLPNLFRKIFRDLKIDPRHYAVHLSLPRRTASHTQVELVKILLEEIGVPAVGLSHQAILTLYAYNTITGIVVDIGDRMDIVPVVDGFIIESGVTRLPYGCPRIIHHLKHSLAQYNISALNDIETYFVRYLMEEACYVSQCYEKEKNEALMNPSLKNKKVPVQDLFKEKLPWQNIIVDSARFQVPEGLFDPDLWGLDCLGLHKLVHKAIKAGSVDVRRSLAENICMSGGATLLPGLVERLQKEVNELTPPSVTPKVHSSPHRYHSAYIGACQLALSEGFSEISVSREEWLEEGPSLLRKWRI